MAQLPQRLTLTQMQQQWAAELNPVISNVITQGQLLMNQKLINGTTVINHKLGQKLTGWFIVGINGAAAVYDNQATNQTPQLTLSLTSNAGVTANIWVF
jgi:hypothetical protein